MGCNAMNFMFCPSPGRGGGPNAGVTQSLRVIFAPQSTIFKGYLGTRLPPNDLYVQQGKAVRNILRQQPSPEVPLEYFIMQWRLFLCPTKNVPCRACRPEIASSSPSPTWSLGQSVSLLPFLLWAERVSERAILRRGGKRKEGGRM